MSVKGPQSAFFDALISSRSYERVELVSIHQAISEESMFILLNIVHDVLGRFLYKQQDLSRAGTVHAAAFRGIDSFVQVNDWILLSAKR